MCQATSHKPLIRRLQSVLTLVARFTSTHLLQDAAHHTGTQVGSLHGTRTVWRRGTTRYPRIENGCLFWEEENGLALNLSPKSAWWSLSLVLSSHKEKSLVQMSSKPR